MKSTKIVSKFRFRLADFELCFSLILGIYFISLDLTDKIIKKLGNFANSPKTTVFFEKNKKSRKAQIFQR